MLRKSYIDGGGDIGPHSTNKTIALGVPPWLRSLVPDEIQLSAMATAGGRLRLRLRFPRELEITVEFVPKDEIDRGFAFVGPDFAIMYVTRGNASRNQRASACRLLGDRLRPETPHVLELMEEARARGRFALASSQIRIEEGSLRTIVDCLNEGEEERARALVDEFAREPQAETIQFLAATFLALDEPLRAREAVQRLSPDCPQVTSLLVRGIASALLGDRESVRLVCEGLMSAVGKHPTSLGLLGFVGTLAEEANYDDLAWAAFEELAKGSPQLGDALPKLRILAEKGPSAFADTAHRLLADPEAIDAIWRLGRICENAGRYDLAGECYELWLKRSAPNSEDTKTITFVRLALARLATWKLDFETARKHLDAVPASERDAIRLRGIIQCLKDDPVAALETFDEILAKWPDERDLELELWRAEALLSLERLDEAREALARAFAVGNSFAAYVIKERLELMASRLGLEEPDDAQKRQPNRPLSEARRANQVPSLRMMRGSALSKQSSKSC